MQKQYKLQNGGEFAEFWEHQQVNALFKDKNNVFPYYLERLYKVYSIQLIVCFV